MRKVWVVVGIVAIFVATLMSGCAAKADQRTSAACKLLLNDQVDLVDPLNRVSDGTATQEDVASVRQIANKLRATATTAQPALTHAMVDAASAIDDLNDGDVTYDDRVKARNAFLALQSQTEAACMQNT